MTGGAPWRRSLVTGAGRPGGIGAAIARRLSDGGIDVVTIDGDDELSLRSVTASVVQAR